MSEHVDTCVLEELREIMEDSFGELLKVFLRESALQNSLLRQHWDTGEREQISALAHALKGCCANIGATHGAVLAAELEKLTAREIWEEVPVLIQVLDTELKLVHEELARLC